MNKIKCGCCKDYHATVTLVKACYATPKTAAAIAELKEKTAVTIVNTPAAPQITIPAHRLAKMKLIEQGALTVKTPTLADILGDDVNPDPKAELAKWAAEQDAKLAAYNVELEKKLEAFEPVETTVLKGQDLKVDALYKLGDDVYKVIWNKSQTFKYAMKMTFTPGWMKKGKFVYAAGIINELDSTMQLDLEGAKGYAQWAFQKFQVGICCNCGKLLTNKDSVAEGIGPVCSGKIKKSWI